MNGIAGQKRGRVQGGVSGRRSVLRWVVLSVSFACGIASAQAASPDTSVFPPGVTLFDRIAAFVGDEIITLFEVDSAVQQNRAMGSPGVVASGGDQRDALRAEALQALIDEELILAEARELEVSVSPTEVDGQIARTARQNGWSPAQLEESVGRLGFTLEEYRAITAKEMLKARVVAIKVGSRVSVSASDVQRVLDAKYGGGAYEKEVRARLILRRIPSEATAEELNEAYRLTRWIQKQAAAAPERFADLARKYSEHDPTRMSGGDLGYFRRGTFADTKLEDAAFSAHKGEVTDVIASPLGLQVVQVTDSRMVPVDDVQPLKDRIYGELFVKAKLEAYRAWVRDLRQASYVNVRIAN